MLGNYMELHHCILSKSRVIIIMAMTKNFQYVWIFEMSYDELKHVKNV